MYITTIISHVTYLDLIDELIASIVPTSGQALRVLVGHARAKGLQHAARSEVLRISPSS